MKVIAEYLWMDGVKPVAAIRGKTKILDLKDEVTISTLTSEEGLSLVPIWGFDGSSTSQAEGHDSDCVLKPVRVYVDPFRTRMRPDYISILVLNEVYERPGVKPHSSNTRANLRTVAELHRDQEFWFGIEQEHTFFNAATARPLGFPREGLPEPQGKYYCGVGADRITGRELTDEHIFACLDAKVLLAGINAEVMPGQWEWQAGNGTKFSDPLRVADDLVISRYLMQRIGEKYGVLISFDPKPVKGDWNGAGAHVNFSNKAMRESLDVFDQIIGRLRENHDAHIAVYGPGIEERLTGRHETCPYNEFKAGVSHRGASIRIPWQVDADKKGYMEDRRPCANIDPYVVEAKIMETVMGR